MKCDLLTEVADTVCFIALMQQSFDRTEKEQWKELPQEIMNLAFCFPMVSFFGAYSFQNRNAI
jgi:hypothetical protein